MERDFEAELEVVFDAFDLHMPSGTGDRRITCPTGTHADKHASASVNRGRGLWTCFACEKGGTGVDLVMEREGMNYADARRRVDELLGGGDGNVPGETSEFFGLRTSRRSKDQRNRKAYRPSWLHGE